MTEKLMLNFGLRDCAAAGFWQIAILFADLVGYSSQLRAVQLLAPNWAVALMRMWRQMLIRH